MSVRGRVFGHHCHVCGHVCDHFCGHVFGHVCGRLSYSVTCYSLYLYNG
jgi:hypothetical protein